jgi:hypothetical protein
VAIQENPPFVLTTNHCLLQPPLADVRNIPGIAWPSCINCWANRPTAGGRGQSQSAQDQFDLGRGRRVIMRR